MAAFFLLMVVASYFGMQNAGTIRYSVLSIVPEDRRGSLIK